MKNVLLILLLISLSACTAPNAHQIPNTIEVETSQTVNTPIVNTPMVDDLKYKELLSSGEQALYYGDAQKAILNHFNPIITHYEDAYTHVTKHIYTARSREEHLFYLATAREEGKEVEVLNTTWSDAYYLKAYALVELKEISNAKIFIEKAVQLAPSNSKYLSELGHFYHQEKEWQKALSTYQSAEKSAQLFSPKELQETELLRAKRGIGYSLTELNELSKAEAVYNEILKIAPNDKIALQELKYIQQVKNKR